MSVRPDFLIVGMQRSGTLWASAVLNAHPQVACFPNLPFEGPEGEQRIGELHFFNTLASIERGNLDNFARPISDYLTKYGKRFADLVPLAGTMPKKEFFATMVKRYSDICEGERGSKKIVGESTPAYVFHLDFIDSLYPNIKKICVLRDPKDRITSWHFSLISKRRKEEGPITEDFAMDYIRERVVPEYEALMRYQGTLHCTTYEKLTNKGVETVQGMCRYLGYPVEPAVAQEMLEKGSFKELTKKQGETRERGEEGQWREELQKKEVKVYDVNPLRKGIVGDWQNYMEPALAEKIDTSLVSLQKEVFQKQHLGASYG